MVDEIPFDFSRRMMSVAIEAPNGERQLLTKGAPEAVFVRCTHFEYDGEIFPMEPILADDLMAEVNDLNSDGVVNAIDVQLAIAAAMNQICIV